MDKITKFESANVNLTIVIVNERIDDIGRVTIIGGTGWQDSQQEEPVTAVKG